MLQFSHPYMTTGKIIALTTQTFVSKVRSLLFNMLSTFGIAFLPRSKYLLISWLQSPSSVILEPSHPPQKNKVFHCFHCFTICFPSSDGTRCHYFNFLNVEFQASFFTLLFHFHQEALQVVFSFCHKGGVICISEVIEVGALVPAKELRDVSDGYECISSRETTILPFLCTVIHCFSFLLAFPCP